MEPPLHLPGDPEQRPVLVLSEDDPVGILLLGLPEALERVGVEEQPSVFVP